MIQNITLNLPYDLSSNDWEKVALVYKDMDGWLGHSNQAYWYGTEQDHQYIYASIEPSGLLISGKISEMMWIGWVTKLCAKLTHTLGCEIYDADM